MFGKFGKKTILKLSDINIRDPFILCENSNYYLYGTRAKNFGRRVNGFDVYTSKDLENWSSAKHCFNAGKFGLNSGVCWAPEVHKYGEKYYMFATFTRKNGMRGTFSLVCDTPDGEFVKHSNDALTPKEWECLDGTLYISKNGNPYLVFCHEHTQIIDGTVCYIRLNDDLSEPIGEAVTLFHGSEPYWADRLSKGEHYITDGPFMYRKSENDLYMIWSTFIGGKYAQCIAKSDNGEIDGNFIHLEPLIKNDGGHGMLFSANDELYLTYHYPNKSKLERPIIKRIEIG